MINTRKRLILLSLVYVLVTLACSTLSVSNKTEFKLLVSVTLPGAESADSHLYQPGEVHDYYPGSGGTYSISVIPQEDYVAEMDKLRANILYTWYKKQDVIRPEETVELTERLATIDRMLSSLSTHSCSGNLMEDSNVMATINMTRAGVIELSCPSLRAE